MRGERWGNRNNCVFSPFSVPSPYSHHPLYIAGLLNDLYSLGKTPALWGGMGVYSMSHPDYPISCYVDRHARCILLIVKFFKLCILFRFAGSLCTEIIWFEFWVNFWKFISQRVVNVTGGGGFTNISPGLPPKQTSFLPRTRNDMRSVFASTRQLSTVITRNQIMDLINYLSAEEWQIAEGGNLEGTEMVVTLNQMDQTHTVQHWVLP